MAYDQVNLTEGAGPKASATDVVGGKHVQIVKPHFGGENVSTPVSEQTPLPTQEVGSPTSLLQRILAALLSPMGYDRSLARSRVTAVVESGTVTTVGTVSTITGGTITNLTNIDGRNGFMLMNSVGLSAWADVHRSRIT